MIGEEFRFYDPQTQAFLKTHFETQYAYEAEAERARNAEEKIARLRAELERLKRGVTAE